VYNKPSVTDDTSVHAASEQWEDRAVWSSSDPYLPHLADSALSINQSVSQSVSQSINQQNGMMDGW